jgi:ArsR family transcriptional regulator, arsenate/arsenite/antimonite-responsive transcriptional repressor
MERTQMEKISKALGNETRLRIFEAIAKRELMNCGEIVAMRGVTPATVSHHLKILSDVGLIESRREGQFVYNRVIPETIAGFTRALTRMSRGRKGTGGA